MNCVYQSSPCDIPNTLFKVHGCEKLILEASAQMLPVDFLETLDTKAGLLERSELTKKAITVTYVPESSFNMQSPSYYLLLLPNELIEEIVNVTDEKDLCNLRTTCKHLELFARGRIFKSIKLEKRDKSLQKLKNICNHPHLAKCVQTFYYWGGRSTYLDNGPHKLLQDRRRILEGELRSMGFGGVLDAQVQPFFARYLSATKAQHKLRWDEEWARIQNSVEKLINVEKLVIANADAIFRCEKVGRSDRILGWPSCNLTALKVLNIEWLISGAIYNPRCNVLGKGLQHCKYFEISVINRVQCVANNAQHGTMKEKNVFVSKKSRWLQSLLQSLVGVEVLKIHIDACFTGKDAVFTLEQATQNSRQWPQLQTLSLSEIAMSQRSLKALLTEHNGTLRTLHIESMTLSQRIEDILVRGDDRSPAPSATMAESWLQILHDIPQWSQLSSFTLDGYLYYDDINQWQASGDSKGDSLRKRLETYCCSGGIFPLGRPPPSSTSIDELRELYKGCLDNSWHLPPTDEEMRRVFALFE